MYQLKVQRLFASTINKWKSATGEHLTNLQTAHLVTGKLPSKVMPMSLIGKNRLVPVQFFINNTFVNILLLFVFYLIKLVLKCLLLLKIYLLVKKRKAGRPAHASLALCRQRQFTSLREDLKNLSDFDSDEETSTTNTNETSHDASIADIVIAHNLEQNVYSDYVAPVNLGNRDCEFDATDLDSVIC